MFRAFGDIPTTWTKKMTNSSEEETKQNTRRYWRPSSSEREIMEKCQFGKEQIEFFANAFTKDGLKPSPHKVKAIKECSPPESKEAVRSFLGMDGYLDNYISNYAAIAAPLYQLTRKDGRKRKKTHSGRYKTPSQTTRQWHSLTHPDL